MCTKFCCYIRYIDYGFLASSKKKLDSRPDACKKVGRGGGFFLLFFILKTKQIWLDTKQIRLDTMCISSDTKQNCLDACYIGWNQTISTFLDNRKIICSW